jgi:hypothetical protein
MQENNAEIPNDDLPERIAQFLDNKIKLTLWEVEVDKN